MRKRITKSVVDDLQPGEAVWDTEIIGFGVRRQMGDARTFCLKKTVKGKQEWIAIGQYGSPFTVDGARKEALKLLGKIASGQSPSSDRIAFRGDPTIADLCNRFIEEHAKPNKKPGSVHMDERNIQNHILPLLSKRKVADITKADIEALKIAVRNGKTARLVLAPKRIRGGKLVMGGPGVANHCLALMSKMMNLAEEWEWRPQYSNPVRFVKKFKGQSRNRFLTENEMSRIGQALKLAEDTGSESGFAIAAIRLLLLTGARRGEILGLRWDYVDYEHKLLRLPDSKTGAKNIILTDESVRILRELPRFDGNPFVIVGGRPGQNLVNLKAPWSRICARAEIRGVRIHDLRHSFASTALMEGISLETIGRLLGHKSPQTTLRYAHLAKGHLTAAAHAVAAKISSAVA